MNTRQKNMIFRLQETLTEYEQKIGLNDSDANPGQIKTVLWEVLEEFQKYPFYTARDLEFTYRIKGNEIFISRKNKSVTRASVNIALDNALELHRQVKGPKKLNCFGASYLYPIFKCFGVIL